MNSEPLKSGSTSAVEDYGFLRGLAYHSWLMVNEHYRINNKIHRRKQLQHIELMFQYMKSMIKREYSWGKTTTHVLIALNNYKEY